MTIGQSVSDTIGQSVADIIVVVVIGGSGNYEKMRSNILNNRANTLKK